MSDIEIDGETALQHHLEGEPLMRRLLGEDERILYGAGFVAGWAARKRWDSSREDEREAPDA